MVFPVVCDPV
jgi:hypothetical protein